MTITFHVYDDQNQLLRSETLDQDVIKVGKLPSSHLKLEDESVSRMHAVIEVQESGEAWVVDLGAFGGTYLNGKKINKAKLTDGDQLRFGDASVLVELGDKIEELSETSAEAIAHNPSLPNPSEALELLNRTADAYIIPRVVKDHDTQVTFQWEGGEVTVRLSRGEGVVIEGKQGSLTANLEIQPRGSSEILVYTR